MSLDLDALLEKTSRTFALAIPMLPEPTRREVTVAYLLFRVADTFEDATAWPRTERIAALHDFSAALKEYDLARLEALTAKWLQNPPVTHAGYLELLGVTPAVVRVLEEFTPSARAILIKHAVRTAEGMAEVFGKALLMSMTGETFVLSQEKIWVRPLAIALALDNSPIEGEAA